jgi:hypothetical protein
MPRNGAGGWWGRHGVAVEKFAVTGARLDFTVLSNLWAQSHRSLGPRHRAPLAGNLAWNLPLVRSGTGTRSPAGRLTHRLRFASSSQRTRCAPPRRRPRLLRHDAYCQFLGPAPAFNAPLCVLGRLVPVLLAFSIFLSFFTSCHCVS